jgi:hypothetical protein
MAAATARTFTSPLGAFSALEPVINSSGGYDPREMSKLLNWKYDEMAGYLGVSASSVEKGLELASAQPRLQELAGLYLRILEAFFGLLGDARFKGDAVATRARSQATAWLNTPLAALDMRRPKELILQGELAVVQSVVEDAAEEVAG